MYKMEFMVLYLAEIIMAALILITAALLIRFVLFIAGLIRKINGDRIRAMNNEDLDSEYVPGSDDEGSE